MTKTNLLYLFIAINIAWILVIFILCAMPGEDIPDLKWNIPHIDKVVHFGMYFILSLLIISPLNRYTTLKLSTIYIIAILISLIYGGTIEILQALYFNRSGDIGDLIADVIGGIAGCLSYPLLNRIYKRLK